MSIAVFPPFKHERNTRETVKSDPAATAFLSRSAGAAHLMRQDARLAAHRPSAFRPWIWRQWQVHSARGLLPSLGWLFWKELPFFLPGNDPDRESSTEQALAYLARSPGVLPATIRVAA